MTHSVAPLDSLVDGPNIRRMRGDDPRNKELAQSVRELGVLQPVLVERVGRRLSVVSGHRRVTAAAMAGLETIPTREIGPLTDRDRLMVQLAENLMRTDLNCVELADALSAYLKASGETQEQLAARLGRSQSWVSLKLGVLRLPPQVKERIEKGILSDTAAEILARYTDLSRADFDRLATKAEGPLAVFKIAANSSYRSQPGSR